MKTLHQHIKEDFKISKNTKFGEPTFYQVFYGINIFEYEYEEVNEIPEKKVVEFASKIYRSSNIDDYMKKFFIMTAEKLVECLDSHGDIGANITQKYIKTAKTRCNTWDEIKAICLSNNWWCFVSWLIDLKQKNKHVNEDFKLSKNTTVYSIVVKDVSELQKIIKKRYQKNNEYLDLRDIDISELTTLNTCTSGKSSEKGLFEGCYETTTIDISSWKTTKIEDMSWMFFDCKKLCEIKGIEELDVTNVEWFKGMFYGCEKLKNVKLNKWNVIENLPPEAFKNMFYKSQMNTPVWVYNFI